jgi:hypothetical protein
MRRVYYAQQRDARFIAGKLRLGSWFLRVNLIMEIVSATRKLDVLLDSRRRVHEDPLDSGCCYLL